MLVAAGGVSVCSLALRCACPAGPSDTPTAAAHSVYTTWANDTGHCARRCMRICIRMRTCRMELQGSKSGPDKVCE